MSVLAIFVLALLLWLLMRPQPAPVPTATPIPPTATATLAATVTTIPQVITPTVTPVLATPTSQPTPTQPAKTPTPTPSCRTGVITAHAAMSAVLATKPERACEGCTYYASVMCQDIGKRYALQVAGDVIPVVVVDCATWAVGEWPQKQGQDWLGELDINSWPNMPIIPLEASLCE